MADSTTNVNIQGPVEGKIGTVTGLPRMKFKTFLWPNNPQTCSISMDRTATKHQYPELDGSSIEDIGTDGAVITGRGEFFGEHAYVRWMELQKVFNEGGTGEFFHPIFNTVKRAELKKLSANLEPRENYVAYEFEFWEETVSVANGVAGVAVKVPTFPWQDDDDDDDSGARKYGTLRRGDRSGWVIDLQKLLIKNGCSCGPSGADGIFGPYTEAAVKKYQKKNKLTANGIAGPATLKKIGLHYYTDSPARPLSGGGGGPHKTYSVHIVSSAHENLGAIASMRKYKYMKLTTSKLVRLNPGLQFVHGTPEQVPYYGRPIASGVRVRLK